MEIFEKECELVSVIYADKSYKYQWEPTRVELYVSLFVYSWYKKELNHIRKKQRTTQRRLYLVEGELLSSVSSSYTGQRL